MPLIQAGATTSLMARQIIDDLTSGLSVLVTGMPRSGRTHLAALVAQEWELSGGKTVTIRGNRSLSERSLAALTMTGVIKDEAVAPGSCILTRAGQALATAAGRPNSALIVDDADFLDQPTTGVIADLRTRVATPWLMTCAEGAQTEPRLVELVASAQPGVALRLTGLPLEDVTALTNDLLGGAATADTISRIATWSGGLPGLIRAIIEVGRRNGHLVQNGGVWQANGDLWDDALQFCLLPYVRDLNRDDQDALALLAGAGGLRRALADELVGADKVRRFARRGLLQADQMSADESLHVFPPALAEWLRRGEGVSQPAVDMGKMPATGPAAAAMADRIRTHWRGEVAALWAAWDADRTAANAVPLLAALFSSAAGDHKIAKVLSKTTLGDDEKADTEFAGLTATYHAMWEHDLPKAQALLEEHRRRYPHLDAHLRGIEAHLILVCERVPSPAQLHITTDDATAEILHAARAEAMLAQGRVRDAAEQLALLKPSHHKVAVLKRTLLALAKVMGDDVETGVETAIQRLREAACGLDPLSISGYAYVAGLGLCMLGRFDELESVVEVVHRLGDTNIFQNHYKTGLFLLGSFIADWEGRADYSRNLVMQAQSLGLGLGPFPGMLAGVSGDPWDAVDELLGRQYVAAAIYLAVAAVEHNPDPVRASTLVKLGLTSQSRVLRALTQYVDTVASGDPSRFEATVAQLRAVCGPLDATRARIAWALKLKEQGDQAGWLEQASAAWAESAGLARRCDGLLNRLVNAVDLTQREAEVAGCAAQGFSSPEIAAQMGVSTRTIETYLQAVYRKTGVCSREELRSIATTWLALRV